MKDPKRVKKEKDSKPQSKAVVYTSARALTAEQFRHLADVPPEREWFENITNLQTRRAYKNDVTEFARFTGIVSPEEFRTVNRAHVIAWRKDLEKRELAPSTLRRKLSAVSALFNHLCECNAVLFNPTRGVKRPAHDANEGKTPAIGDSHARALLDAPASETLKGKRDRAILSSLLYHGLRRAELCALKVKDLQERRGVPHLRIHGKGGKIRFVPTHPGTLERISEYLEASEHRDDLNGPLFRPVKNPLGTLKRFLTADGVYKLVNRYAEEIGLKLIGFCAHALRATAATNALDHEADIAKVQEWLGHSHIATTRLYDRRKTRPEDSPTFKVAY